MVALTNYLGLSTALVASLLALQVVAAPAPAIGEDTAAGLTNKERGVEHHGTFTLPVQHPSSLLATRPTSTVAAAEHALNFPHKSLTLPVQPPATARAIATRPPICDVACPGGHVDPTTCSCIEDGA